MARVAKRRAVPTGPAAPESRQMTIGSARWASAPSRRASTMPLARAVARLLVKRDAAEALTERAIRETRNLEDVAAEILEREAAR